MESDDDLNVVGVLRTHLEEMYSVLRNARTCEEAFELADAVRQGRHQVKPGWLVRQLNRAIEHVEGYLAVELDEDVSEN